MSYIRLFVTLKITDNVALSALHSLRTRLGFSSLGKLRRSDYWEFAFPGLSAQQARQTVEELVQKTSFFVNPNKHDWEFQTADCSLDREASTVLSESVSAAALVCDREDGKAEATLQACHDLLPGDSALSSLKRGVWWEMEFKDLPRKDLAGTVQNITITKSRTQGLLANPHYQTYQFFYS